jgi:predicted DsbA family dithiol-disulfide isomerase
MSDKTKLTVEVIHDYICPWCWVGYFQAKRLEAEFPKITLDWKGYELLPEGRFDVPAFAGPKERDPAKPLSRFEIHAQSEGVPYNPNRSIGFVFSHDALEGAEFAKAIGPKEFDSYNEGVYRAYWERSEDISDLTVLSKIAGEAELNVDEFAIAVQEKRFNHLIVPFDDEAYADDITHVPTFRYRGERTAEAPYAVIRDLTQRFLTWYDK